jgi:hypothetical protein
LAFGNHKNIMGHHSFHSSPLGRGSRTYAAHLRQMLSYVVFSCCISIGGPHGSQTLGRQDLTPEALSPFAGTVVDRALPTNSVLAARTFVPDRSLRRNRSNAKDARSESPDPMRPYWYAQERYFVRE